MTWHDLTTSELLAYVVGALGTIGGMGGIAAYVRARGQNANDGRNGLTEAEARFRGDQSDRIVRLETRLDEMAKRNDALESENTNLRIQVALLTRDRERQDEELTRLRVAQHQSDERMALLTTRLDSESAARAAAVQRAQVAQATSEILERENRALRQENEHLHVMLAPNDAPPPPLAPPLQFPPHED